MTTHEYRLVRLAYIIFVVPPCFGTWAYCGGVEPDTPPAGVVELDGQERPRNRGAVSTPMLSGRGGADPDRRDVHSHSGSEAGLQKTVYRVELADPVSPAEPPRIYEVVLSRDRNRFPIEYALSFQTHVCTDGQCEPVDLTMTWNALGHFLRLKCPPGKPLTKKEHAPFTAEDYAKLDRILKDRNAILGGWTLDFLDRPVETSTGGDGVDAVTSPTPISVQESVIQDAAYTTWALWHWANGEIVPKLLNITRQSCTPAYLNHLLVAEDESCVSFALDYVMEHHASDAQFVKSIFHVLENGQRDQIMRSLDFLSQAIPDKQKLHARLIESCCRMRANVCPLILQRLDNDPDLPETTLETLTGRLNQLPYFPIHLILRMLEKRKFASPKTISDVAALLDSDDFFIARRAYEHLIKQRLDTKTASKVNAFRERNSGRL